ncbi:MAG: DUF4372 domain-containing protein [Sphingobacteriaceae bacterium]
MDRNKFNYTVRIYQGDKHVKHFICWNQLLTLISQLCNCESLRGLVIALDAHRSKCYPLDRRLRMSPNHRWQGPIRTGINARQVE